MAQRTCRAFKQSGEPVRHRWKTGLVCDPEDELQGPPGDPDSVWAPALHLARGEVAMDELCHYAAVALHVGILPRLRVWIPGAVIHHSEPEGSEVHAKSRANTTPV